MANKLDQRRHNPLEHDISTSGGRLRTKSITGKRKSRSDEDFGRNGESGDGYIDARSSKKILAIAQGLADEDQAEQSAKSKAFPLPSTAFDFDSRFIGDDADNAQDEDTDYAGRDEGEEEWMPDEEVAGEDVDPEDLAVYKKFLQDGEDLADFAPSLQNLTTADTVVDALGQSVGEDDQGGGRTTNLADLILARIAEKEAREASQQGAFGTEPIQKQYYGGGDPSDAIEIPATVVETFAKVGMIMSRYRSGPLPKPFKVLPTLPQWPELLSITRPEQWTPHAVYRATKIFISAPQATGQHFCSTILLERVRDDIQENKKLNPRLYEALMASFYRPAAFFKGFLFPLVEQGCTLREAQIISSVLTKHKIPVLHSAAAILRLCEISAEQTVSINSEAAGAANIFIRVLLAKKYALPYKVVDGLVFHFLRFRGSKEEEALGAKEAKLPVLWHQSLLIFAQTYRNEITEDQREALLDLLLVRGHKDIGPEVRRELLAGRNRAIAESQREGGEVMNIDATGSNAVARGVTVGTEDRDDGDDTMDIA